MNPRNANGQRVLFGPRKDTKPWLSECVICEAPLPESRVLGDLTTCCEAHERTRLVMDRLHAATPDAEMDEWLRPVTIYTAYVTTAPALKLTTVFDPAKWPELPLEDEDA